jgi:hypothetical protein
MNREQGRSGVDAPSEPISGPSIALVRPRGESHLLALATGAAVVVVAIAIAKPWSGPSPGPAAATPTPATIFDQPVNVAVQPGEVPTTGIAACPQRSPVSPLAERSPRYSNLSAQAIGPITGPRLGAIVVVCSEGNLIGPGKLFQ